MLIASLALVIVIITGAVVAYINIQDTHSAAANNLLYEARKSLEDEEKTFAAASAPAIPAATTPPATPNAKAPAKPAAPAAANPEAVAFKKIDVSSKFPESLKKYKAVIDQFPGAQAAFESRMALGTLYFNHGDPAAAMSWFQQASDQAPRTTDRAAALQSVGYSLENQGKATEALQVYQKALDQGDTTIRGDLLLGMGRCYEILKDPAKARAAYDQVISQLPNTDASKSAQSAEMRLPPGTP
jgi:tetratricopeptide (TPR) repeat protein